jgi:hypothetical protein
VAEDVVCFHVIIITWFRTLRSKLGPLCEPDPTSLERFVGGFRVLCLSPLWQEH